MLINLSAGEVTGNFKVQYGEDGLEVPGSAEVAFQYPAGDETKLDLGSVTLTAYQTLIVTWEYSR